MFTSRNIATIALIIGVGALGWFGGARFAPQHEAAAPLDHEAQRPSAQTAAPAADKHAGHGHAEEQDEHAGHGHGEKPEPGEICAEHRMPEAEDVLCNPGLMTTLLPGEGVKMRLATPEAADRAGIVIAAAQPASVAGGPAIPAQVIYNRGRLAEVMALSGGVVRRIAAEPGQAVARGALLAEIASPGAAAARGDYQAALGRLELAVANVRREQELVAKGVSARMELEQAQAEQQAAKGSVEQLREQLAAFGAGTSSGGGTQLTLRSPLAGTVVARSAVVGQTLAPETPLFTVADLSSMWLELQLSADQVAQAKIGATVEAEIDGLPGQRFPGKIVQVAAGLDERTRLLQVVAEIANPDRVLKDGMFGQARLVAAEAADDDDAEHHEAKAKHDHDGHSAGEDHGRQVTVAVPAAAVQAIDGKAYVFVAHAEPDLFELRRVEAGPRRGGDILVTAGLAAGEKIAASQGFALKSELLKSRLGASCADH
ncbi:MAG: efflux RND transporter periplasmic adaptor subunit [Desulfuromonadales bacterium]|nr:efflux RND transporter periplasmic adaptor subunit [Desulfuromonadales bacterium]